MDRYGIIIAIGLAVSFFVRQRFFQPEARFWLAAATIWCDIDVSDR